MDKTLQTVIVFGSTSLNKPRRDEVQVTMPNTSAGRAWLERWGESEFLCPCYLSADEAQKAYCRTECCAPVPCPMKSGLRNVGQKTEWNPAAETAKTGEAFVMVADLRNRKE